MKNIKKALTNLCKPNLHNLLVVLLILFAIILGEMNFMLVSTVFLFLGFYLYDRRDYIFMIILSLLGGGFSYGLFVYFLKLPL